MDSSNAYEWMVKKIVMRRSQYSLTRLRNRRRGQLGHLRRRTKSSESMKMTSKRPSSEARWSSISSKTVEAMLRIHRRRGAIDVERAQQEEVRDVEIQTGHLTEQRLWRVLRRVEDSSGSRCSGRRSGAAG